MRILIVGAGIAGMTLAALLERRGVRPVIIERASSTAAAGYMLGLYRLGSRVLHGLGLYEKFQAESLEVKHYVALDDRGDRISQWSLAPLSGRYGPLLSCTRPQLVELMRGGMGAVEIRFDESITAIDASAADHATATFSSGGSERFDLIVGADGINSQVRKLVFGEQPRFDTGWGGWVYFAPSGVVADDTMIEQWGAGRFIGVYPTRVGVGVFAGGEVVGGFDAREGRRDRLRARFAGMGAVADELLQALPSDDVEMFFWRLADVRSAAWVHHRVVLLGDAAAGFLPTAGVGASMAMESAAVLNDELSRTDAQFLDQALALYVKRRRERVEAIQNDSRKLARLVLVKSAPVAAARNFVSRFMTLEMAMSSITKAFEQPI